MFVLLFVLCTHIIHGYSCNCKSHYKPPAPCLRSLETLVYKPNRRYVRFCMRAFGLDLYSYLAFKCCCGILRRREVAYLDSVAVACTNSRA